MAFRILYDAASDASSGVTITASSEAKDADNLAANIGGNTEEWRIGKPWRTTGDSSEWVKFDFGSSQTITCVAIMAHNLTSGATVALQANSSDTWGSPSYSQALTIATDSDSNVIPRLVYFKTAGSLYRYWRLLILDPTNPDTYIQIGRVVLGQEYEATRDLSSDLRVELIDPSEGSKSPGEVPVLTQKARFRRIRSSFQFVGQTETDKWATIFDHLGNSRGAIICWDTDRPSKDSAYVFLATPMNLAHQLVSYYDIMSLVWEEKTR
jgi:hypothetical protein